MTRSGSRRAEALRLVAALIAILAATAVASRMLVAAWDDHGLVYHLVHGFGRTMGWGIRGTVVFAALLGVVLVVAFALDEDKHVQGILLLAAIALVFVPTLVVLGRWRIEFLAYPTAVAAGLVAGVVVAAVGGTAPPFSGGRVSFPNAARALYAAVSGTAVVGFFERYLTYESPIVVVENTPTIDQVAAGPLTPVVDLFAVSALVYLMGYFTRYSDVTDVVISSPDDDTVSKFLGGLYDAAKHRYGATTLQGGDVLNAAASRQHSRPPITGRVAFQYQPGSGVFVRRREVGYDNIRPVSDDDADALAEIAAERSSLGSRLWYGFRRQLLLAAPTSLRSLLRRSGGAHLDRLIEADVILLLAPLDDIIDQYLVEEGGEFDESWVNTPAYLREETDNLEAGAYHRIGEACSGASMPDVYVVATDADIALDLDVHGGDDFDDDEFLNFLRTDILGLGAAYRGRVLPVAGIGSDSDGYDHVLGSL
jgi:hypothetical protein